MFDPHKLREQARRALQAAAPAATNAAGVEAVRRSAHKVLEAQLALIPKASRSPLACGKGCSLCCHLRVMAMPVEVLGLADYMTRCLAPAALAEAVEGIARTAAVLHALPRGQLLLTNVPCPLLRDGACSMYAARPMNCRAYHSLDYQACLASFDDPTDLSLTHPQSANHTRVNEGVQQGFSHVVSAAALDAGQYELVTALAETFADPDAAARFARGEPAFRQALRI
jgi:hypothetical protein